MRWINVSKHIEDSNKKYHCNICGIPLIEEGWANADEPFCYYCRECKTSVDERAQCKYPENEEV